MSSTVNTGRVERLAYNLDGKPTEMIVRCEVFRIRDKGRHSCGHVHYKVSREGIARYEWPVEKEIPGGLVANRDIQVCRDLFRRAQDLATFDTFHEIEVV